MQESTENQLIGIPSEIWMRILELVALSADSKDGLRDFAHARLVCRDFNSIMMHSIPWNSHFRQLVDSIPLSPSVREDIVKMLALDDPIAKLKLIQTCLDMVFFFRNRHRLTNRQLLQLCVRNSQFIPLQMKVIHAIVENHARNQSEIDKDLRTQELVECLSVLENCSKNQKYSNVVRCFTLGMFESQRQLFLSNQLSHLVSQIIRQENGRVTGKIAIEFHAAAFAGLSPEGITVQNRNEPGYFLKLQMIMFYHADVFKLLAMLHQEKLMPQYYNLSMACIRSEHMRSIMFSFYYFAQHPDKFCYVLKNLNTNEILFYLRHKSTSGLTLLHDALMVNDVAAAIQAFRCYSPYRLANDEQQPDQGTLPAALIAIELCNPGLREQCPLPFEKANYNFTYRHVNFQDRVLYILPNATPIPRQQLLSLLYHFRFSHSFQDFLQCHLACEELGELHRVLNEKDADDVFAHLIKYAPLTLTTLSLLVMNQSGHLITKTLYLSLLHFEKLSEALAMDKFKFFKCFLKLANNSVFLQSSAVQQSLTQLFKRLVPLSRKQHHCLKVLYVYSDAFYTDFIYKMPQFIHAILKNPQVKVGDLDDFSVEDFVIAYAPGVNLLLYELCSTQYFYRFINYLNDIKIDCINISLLDWANDPDNHNAVIILCILLTTRLYHLPEEYKLEPLKVLKMLLADDEILPLFSTKSLQKSPITQCLVALFEYCEGEDLYCKLFYALPAKSTVSIILKLCENETALTMLANKTLQQQYMLVERAIKTAHDHLSTHSNGHQAFSLLNSRQSTVSNYTEESFAQKFVELLSNEQQYAIQEAMIGLTTILINPGN